MLPHQERVVKEQTELQEKLDKLYAFTVGDLFKTVPEVEQKLLNRQMQYMIEYNGILLERIELFKVLA